MGILNVTPDSFHAKSRVGAKDAVDVGTRMIAEGADWLDVGGESTRPGAVAISIEEELERVIPVISALIENNPSILISIDTRRAPVAEAALRAGASMINDVSGLRSQEMFDLVVESGCAVCIMHMQGEPDGMQSNPAYSDVRSEVEANLVETASSLVSNGHDPALICLDPGIGFGKGLSQNLDLLHQRGFSDYSVMWGVSRKSLFNELLNRPSTDDRLAGTLGVAAHAMLEGVDLLRVHDVAEHSDLLMTMATLRPEVSR
jgi:dihydropteroate synthase